MTLYAHRNPRDLEPYLSRHMEAMTAEGLHDKGDIACELAWRDAQIERLQEALTWYEDKIHKAIYAADLVYCKAARIEAPKSI